MSKLFSLSVVMLLCPFLLFSQEYTLTLEEHATDIVPGLTTYRMYIDMVNTDDFLSSIYGGGTSPLMISTSNNSFFNSGFGGSTASAINPAFLSFFPDLAADSWVTIGIEQQETGDEVAISTLEDPDQPFVECFAAGSALDGQNVVIDSPAGGAWYVLNGAPNGVPDEDMRVLFLQMTTAGEICGTINAQVFENGNGAGSANLLFTFTFCGVGTYDSVIFGCTDIAACNFDPEADQDDGSCDYLCPGCTDSWACNYNMQATGDDGSCEYVSCVGCTDETACNFDPTAIYEIGSCDYVSCVGCTDEDACNYDPIFTVDNGSCDYSCLGCTDETACNYDANTTGDDGSCTYAETYYDCDGNCLMDMDSDGVCDELEVAGCTDLFACNYNPEATEFDGSCDYSCFAGCTNPNACNYDADALEDNGSCDYTSCVGCTDVEACNYDSIFTIDNGSCDYSCLGCTDLNACNYSPSATVDDGSCTYNDTYFDCDGNCYNDFDGDGVCNELEVPGCTFDVACNFEPTATEDDGSCYFYCPGCTDEAACNYDAGAIQEDGSCEYPVDWYGVDYVDCDNVCLNDNDGDGVCDEDEIPGCTDPVACNYFAEATDQLIPCEYPDEGYDCEGSCLNDTDEDGLCDPFDACPLDAENDADGDGVCGNDELEGCTNDAACNYDPMATDDDGTCETIEMLCGASYFNCDCTCQSDADGDGVCDEVEVPGCQESSACNFNVEATDSDGSCEWSSCAGCIYVFACNYDPTAIYSDGSCEFGTCPGCTDPTACNFNPTVSEDDGSCTVNDACGECGGSGPVEGYNCDGSCIDSDEDEVCDFDEAGCTDNTACNFAPLAQEDDGSCTYPETCFDCTGACLDENANGICDCDEVYGCIDSEACNFQPAANVDDGSCAPWVYVTGGCYSECPTCLGELLNDADGDGVCDSAEVGSCTDAEACNYDECATDDDGSCLYPENGYDCEGNCTADVDGDCVCDPEEIYGCTYAGACNFNPEATEEDGSCIVAETFYDCDGNCLEDQDADGVCDELEVLGCNDPMACNFQSSATEDDDSCWYPADDYLGCDGLCINDADGDGVCDEVEVAGCQDCTACNYNSDATDEDGSCVYPEEGLDCEGNCLLDADGNGTCDDAELALLISFLNSGELCGPGTFWDQATGQCTTADQCPMDFDGNGEIGSGDLLLFLAQYSSVCDASSIGDCGQGVFDSNVDGNAFVVCPDVQFVTVILTGASGGSGGTVCGQTVGASTCNLCDATGGNGGLSTAIEFTINNLSAGDELALVPGILGADSDEVITCNPGFNGWTNWDCGPASDGENGGTTQLLLNGEVIAEISGGSGGSGACIGCQGDGCFNGSVGQSGEVTLVAPWIFYSEETQLVGAQGGQMVLYY